MPKKEIQYNDPEYLNLWRKLALNSRALQKIRGKELWQYGISSPEAMVLSAVNNVEGDVTPGNIARWSLANPHAVSMLLKRMEKRGLVTKTRDTKSKNRIIITLTEKGEQAWDKASQRITIYKIMSSLSKRQRSQLDSCLYTLHKAAIQELGMDYQWFFP